MGTKITEDKNSEIRKKAKRILFDTLLYQGLQEVLFPNSSIKDSNSIIETVIDAMIKFNNIKK